MTTDLTRQTALRLGELIHAREVSAVEVVHAHLQQIEALNPRLNAVTRTMADDAERRATEADVRAAAGTPLGPLDGVPFSSKENIDCMGAPTTEGLIAMADNMPLHDAPIVERMKAAGAIPLARTNMPDLGLRVHTDNALHGATLNPWNPDLTCGGSSGGEGVAIASGMSPMGLGNDIGGSVRNPAYCSGILAHKATPHRLPRASSTPPTSWGPAKQYMSVEGPMARSATDLRSMFSIMHGRHPLDPWSVTTPFADASTGARPAIALVPEPAGGDTDPEVAAGVRAAGYALRDQGFDVTEVQPPDLEGVVSTWRDWLGGEIELRREIIDPVLGPDSRKVLDLFHADIGTQNLESTIDALTNRHGHAQAWVHFMQSRPIIVGPVWTQKPFPVGYDIESLDAVQDVMSMLRFTVAANVLGLPATAVPVGLDASGTPLGVQVIGQHHADDLCLEIAAVISESFPIAAPPVHLV